MATAKKAPAKSATPADLQRERITRWLDKQEAARDGKPLSPEAMQFAEKAWRERA